MIYLAVKGCRLELEFSAGKRFAKVLERAKSRKTTTSKFQESVENAVRHIVTGHNEKIQSEAFIESIGSHCDLYIEIEGGKRIIIEADGRYHYLPDSKTLNFETLLKTKILERCGYVVIRIPYFVWDELKTKEEEQTFLLKDPQLKLLSTVKK